MFNLLYCYKQSSQYRGEIITGRPDFPFKKFWHQCRKSGNHWR